MVQGGTVAPPLRPPGEEKSSLRDVSEIILSILDTIRAQMADYRSLEGLSRVGDLSVVSRMVGHIHELEVQTMPIIQLRRPIQRWLQSH